MLKVFDAVVTPTVMYGSETLAFKNEQGEMLRIEQHKMLRQVLGTHLSKIDVPDEEIVRNGHELHD